MFGEHAPGFVSALFRIAIAATIATPAMADWVSDAPMSVARAQHAGALLDDGSFAVFNGVNLTGFVNSAERFSGNVWSALGATGIIGNVTEAVTLGSGHVLVRSDGGRQSRLFDPVSSSWADTGSQNVQRSLPTMTLLADGKVLLAGGTGVGGVRERSAEIYDPVTRTWTPTGSMALGRSAHAATLMRDGRVLVASGFNQAGEVPSAEIYDPVSGTWSQAAPPLVARHYASLNLLPDGRLLLAGGHTGASVTSQAELYDPVANTWTATGALAYPRNGTMGSLQQQSTVLVSGKVLIAGGSDIARTSQVVAELYDAATGTWSQAGVLAQGRENGTANLLPSGEVLITGGFFQNPAATFVPNTDRYQPTVPSGTPPEIDPLPLLQRRGAALTLTGTGFNGDSGISTPRLHIQRVENGYIFPLLSATSVSDTSFVSPPLDTLPAGLYMVRLIVDGVPSSARLIRFTDPAGTPAGVAGDRQISVSWAPPADDRGNPPEEYEVASSPASAGCVAVAPSTQCTVAGLTNGTSYTFTVRAKHANGLGPESASSLAIAPVALSSQTIDFGQPLPHKFGTTYLPQATATSGLSVGFVVDSGPCAAQQPSGAITFTGIGDCTIRATQSGDSTYLPAADVVRVLVVEKGQQVLRFNPIPPSTASVGELYSPMMEGGASGSPVVISVNGVAKLLAAQKAVAQVCAFDAGTVAFGAEGTCTITATQDGDANYDPAVAQSYAITVTSGVVVPPQATPVPSLSQFALMLLSAAMSVLVAIGFRRAQGR